MAFTQDQIYEKLKNWHPKGWVEDHPIRKAHYKAMAYLVSVAQTDMEATKELTYLGESSASWLDEHGNERSIKRKLLETDTSYLNRIRSFGASVAEATIESAINDILASTGTTCTLFKIKEDGPFWEDVFFGTVSESFVFSRTFIYNIWALYLPVIQFLDTTGNVTVAATSQSTIPRLRINTGHTYTVNGVLTAYEIINNGTLIADTIAGGVVISGTGTTSTNGNGGSVALLDKSDWYSNIVDTIDSAKAVGTDYEVYSEQFE